jgi:tetratricopeptide (TPR) repeat protein
MLGYQIEDRNQEALDYHRNGLKIFADLNDKVSMAKAFNNMGLVLGDLIRYQEALDYHRKALEIDEDLNDRVGMG